MLRKIWVLLLLITPFYLIGQVNRVDHVYLQTPHAQDYFHFFKDSLGLPVAWDFQNWGVFNSGGISLGNINLEFIEASNENTRSSHGLAFEPGSSAEDMLKGLQSKALVEEGVQKYYSNQKLGARHLLWSTIDVKLSSSSLLRLFVCDYDNRLRVHQKRVKNQNLLLTSDKNRLGILGVKEILLACESIHAMGETLSTIPGIHQHQNLVYRFQQGSSIRLVENNKTAIKAIRIHVKSPEKTKVFLDTHRDFFSPLFPTIQFKVEKKGTLLMEWE